MCKRPKVIGDCPICGREMLKGGNIDKHHFIPRSQGGTDSEYLHLICHQKIHSLFSNTLLADMYNTPEKLKAHPDMQKFIKWVSKKKPNFYSKNKRSNNKGRKH